MVEPQTVFFQAFVVFLMLLLLYTAFIGSVYITILVIKKLYSIIKEEMYRIEQLITAMNESYSAMDKEDWQKTMEDLE